MSVYFTDLCISMTFFGMRRDRVGALEDEETKTKDDRKDERTKHFRSSAKGLNTVYH